MNKYGFRDQNASKLALELLSICIYSFGFKCVLVHQIQESKGCVAHVVFKWKQMNNKILH